MVRPLGLERFVSQGLERCLRQSCNYCETTTQSCQSAHRDTVIFSSPPPLLQPSTFGLAQPLKRRLCSWAARRNTTRLSFAQLFRFRRYSWRWLRHNYKIYILLSVVLETDAHALHTQARRRHLSYTHLEEMMLVWGLAGLQQEIMMYRKTTDKTICYLETPQTIKMSELASQRVMFSTAGTYVND